MKRLCFLFMVVLGLNFCSAQVTIYDTINSKKDKGFLWKLAEKHKHEGCSTQDWVDSIKKWNSLSNNNVKDGMVLIVDIIKESKVASAKESVCETTTGSTDISIIPRDSSKVKLPIGKCKKLDPSINGKLGNYIWKSSHPKIVSVDDNGVITTHAKGSATITAKSKQRRQNCRWTITVEDGSESADGDAEPTGLSLKKFLLSIVIIAFVVIIVARKWNSIVGLFSKQRMNLQSDIAVNNGLLEQISKLEGEKNRLLNENNRLQRENVALEKKITALKSQLDEIIEDNIRTGKELDDLKAGANNKSLNANNKENAPSRSQTQSQNPTVLYADAIVDGALIRVKEVPGDDSIFELHLNNSNTANVVICKNAVQRIIANPSFIDGCEKQILPNASNVEIVTPGTAQKEADSGKWVVVEKLKVNIK